MLRSGGECADELEGVVDLQRHGLLAQRLSDGGGELLNFASFCPVRYNSLKWVHLSPDAEGYTTGRGLPWGKVQVARLLERPDRLA